MANFTRDPWQDPMVRFTTVPAAKTLEASEVFQGFIGSWAAEYVVHNAMMDDISTPENGMPAQPRTISSHLGHPGFPEINFVPYAHGTNRFGPKGGALLGCPVSFSIVGPTLKRGHRVNWQWVVTDNSATPGVGDTLTLDDYVIDFSASPPAEVSIGAYNLWNLYQISDISSFPGGLYVVITHPGSKGSLTEGGVLVDGGVGTGSIWEFITDGDTRGPLSPNSESSLYEIFRVIDISGSTLTLDPNKRLADYYTFPVGVDRVVVRGITIMEPKAARLVAIQDGVAAGDETTFVVVPPDRAANDDQQYPWMTLPINGGWHDSEFQEDAWNSALAVTDGTCDTDLDFEYLNPPQLPVPKPVGQGTFRLWGVSGEGVATDVGPGRMWLILDDPSNIKWGDAPSVGDIIHIYNVKQVGNVVLADINPPTPTLENILGWYEVVRIPFAGKYVVRRVDDVDPNTGRPFYGTAMLLAMYSVGVASGERIEIEATIHKPVTSLWNTSTYDIDAIDSARLTNIIDPSWVGRSIKGRGNSLLARADRAIFDTAYDSDANTYANPGSLLDLGFRMVFFPAKTRRVDIPNPVTGGNPPWVDPLQTVEVLVPDFDHPIDSREVLLDPSKPNEKQWIDVDYSNGIVRLSHAVKSGSPFYNPAIFTSADNPRGAMTLFASFVPYSREPGQLGSGIRAVSGAPVNELDVPCQPQGTEHESSDVYGARKVLTLYPGVTNTIDNTRGDPTYSILINGGENTLRTIPASGFVEVLTGVSADGEPEFLTTEHRGTLFGYYAAVYEAAPTAGIRLYGWYGGGTAVDGSFSYDANTRGVVVFRKDVTLPNAPDGVAGTPFQYDTTYGHAKRSGTVRFGDAELRHNADGSISVIPRDTIAKSIQDGLKITLGYTNLLDGGEVTVVAEDTTTVTLGFTGITYLYHGETHVHGPAELVIPKEAGPILQYIWWDGKYDYCELSYQADLPVSDELILLAKAEIPGSPTVGTVLTDLRYPLKDFDERTDVFVGMIPSPDRKRTPWFSTLAKAVAYCSELMNPAAGDPGKGMRIRVVGPTVETETPIVIKTDGLTIEGSPGSPGAGSIVQWGGGALFDLNGHSELEFRDLNFQCITSDTVGEADISATTATGGTSTLRVYLIQDPAVYIDVSEVTPATGVVIDVGATVQLQATTTGAADTSYSWYTSDPTIATVVVSPGAGTPTTVTGVAPGKVDIWARGDVSGVIGMWHLNIRAVGAPAATYVGGPVQCRQSGNITLQAQLNPGGPEPVTWASSSAEFTVTAGLLTPANLPANVVFTDSQTSSSRLTIDHCIASSINGFIDVEGSMVSTLNSWNVRDNNVFVSDYFIRVKGSNLNLIHWDVTGNIVQWNQLGPYLIYLLPNDCAAVRIKTSSASSIRFEGNVLSGFGSWVPLRNQTYEVLLNLTIFAGRPVTFNLGILDGWYTRAIWTDVITSGGVSFIGNVLDDRIPGFLSISEVSDGTVFDRNIITTGGDYCRIRLGNYCKADGNVINKTSPDVVPYQASTIICGNGCQILNNRAAQIVFRNRCVITGNVLGDAIWQWDNDDQSEVIIKGNEIGKMSGYGPPYNAYNGFSVIGLFSYSIIEGNSLGGTFSCTRSPAAESSHDSVCANNVVMDAGHWLLGGDKHVFVGNRIGAGDVGINGDGASVSGNVITGNLAVLKNCMVQGNVVSGDITVGVGCSILCNKCSNIQPNPDPEITAMSGLVTPAIGNRVSGTVFGAGVTGGLRTGNEN